MDETGSFWFSCIRNNIFRMVTTGLPFNSVYVRNSSFTAQTFRNSILEDRQNNIWVLFNGGTYMSDGFNQHSLLSLSQFRFPDGDIAKGSGFRYNLNLFVIRLLLFCTLIIGYSWKSIRTS